MKPISIRYPRGQDVSALALTDCEILAAVETSPRVPAITSSSRADNSARAKPAEVILTCCVDTLHPPITASIELSAIFRRLSN
jgi:hypothetical protein